MLQLILASQSPRRRQLIKLLGHAVQTTSAGVDEESVAHPDPRENVLATADLKTQAVAPQFEGAIIIAADTEVALDGQVLGKPADERAAATMLQRLRGRDHQVHTGLVLLDTRSLRQERAVCTTSVFMRDYSDGEIGRYIASGDPFDKAGGYAIQHSEFNPVAHIRGCYSNVVGLPLCRLRTTLRRLGVASSIDVDEAGADYRRCSTCLELMAERV